MDLQLIVVNPSDNLVTWASQPTNSNVFKNPKDRPWYQLNASPSNPVSHFEIPCKCGKQKIKMTGHQCCDPNQSVYIGQCGRCEIIVWTYRKESSNVQNIF
jgi:hypothetical protein